MSAAGEKTEKPTPRKLKEARREGNVARSADFTGTAVMLAAAAALVLTVDSIAARLLAFTEGSLRLATAGEPASPAQLGSHLIEGLSVAAHALAPVLATAFVMAAFVAYVQVGPGFSPSAVLPDTERLNPGAGWKRLFSSDRLVDLAKNIVRLSVMTTITALVFGEALAAVVWIPRGTLARGVETIGATAFDQSSALLLALVVFAIADLLWQRHTFTRDLMMTKQEVKEEHRQAEGDPQLKSRRRRLHRDLLEGAGLNRIEDADAVVVNPTHVAVAIRYREEEMHAPRVVARGRGDVARTIRRLARRHRVPIVREVALARSLVELDLEAEIPEELYDAVAEVLHFVYSLEEAR